MVKVKVETVDRSYYDDTTDTIVVRRSLLTPEDPHEFEEIMTHEVTHALIKNRAGNLLFEYGRLALMIFLVVGGLYFQFVYMPDTSFADCARRLAKCQPFPVNLTAYRAFNISSQQPQ